MGSKQYVRLGRRVMPMVIPPVLSEFDRKLRAILLEAFPDEKPVPLLVKPVVRREDPESWGSE